MTDTMSTVKWIVESLAFPVPHSGGGLQMLNNFMKMAPALALLCAAAAQAGDCGWHRSDCCPAPCAAPCQPCCQPVACAPACEEVTRTVMVPEWTTERRTITCTEYRHEQQERTITCCRPVWREEQREVTVMVPRQEMRTVTRTVCRPVWREEQRTVTVMVPHQEERQGTRIVCEMVPTEVEQTYCEMVPHQEERTMTRCVYDTVTEDVEETFCVMVPHTETRTCTRTVCDRVTEQVTRTICVDRGQWVCETIADPCNPCCTRSVRRWCPNIVEEQVTCNVCRMVPRHSTRGRCSAPAAYRVRNSTPAP
jgi:hypothetical protein